MTCERGVCGFIRLVPAVMATGYQSTRMRRNT